jgi:hypothetical protein
MTEIEKTEAERFQKVRDLFGVAAELPVARRQESLRLLTDDDSIVQEVLALCLANEKDSTTHFSKPLSSVLQSAAAQTIAPDAPVIARLQALVSR